VIDNGAKKMENLWPNIDVNAVPPVFLLKQQASLLSKTTNGVLKAFVTSDFDPERQIGPYCHVLFITSADKCSGEGADKYEAVSIHHGYENFPCSVGGKNCSSFADVCHELEKVLTGDRVRSILESLIARYNEIKFKEEDEKVAKAAKKAKETKNG